MPSKNPRLSVVLPPSVAATLAAISEETGESASSLVRGLLEQTEPALQRLLELVRAAKGAKGQIGAGVSSAMHRVVEDLHDALAVADARQQRVIADLVHQAEGVKGRRRRSGQAHAERAPAGAAPVGAGPTPVPVTRGSGGRERPGKGGAGRVSPGVIEGAIDALQEAGRLSAKQARGAKAAARGRRG